MILFINYFWIRPVINANDAWNIFKTNSKSFMMTDCSNNNNNDGDGNGNDNADNENSAATAAVYWKQLVFEYECEYIIRTQDVLQR